MIELSLSVITSIVGGELVGDDVTVQGPVVIDSREATAGALFVAFLGEHADGHDFVDKAASNGAVACLGSRPTSLPTVVVPDVQRALQLLASAVVARLRDGLTVIAVTGSAGKTSTKDLMAAVFAHADATVATQGSFNNEIGMPLTALRADSSTRFLVLEMGARGVGHIRQLTDLIRPDIAVVLNVGTAHIGEFGSRDAIALAKGELVEALLPTGVAVLNADDERVASMASRTGARVRTFSTGSPANVRVEDLVLDDLGRPRFTLVVDEDTRLPVALRLVGAHQAANAAAAAAAALAAGLPADLVVEALEAVVSLSKWRMELHELPSGIVLLNDAYNANPESMRAALDALARIGQSARVKRTIAVLGEMRELGDTSYEAHRGVGAYAADAGIDELVVVSEAARGLSDGAPGQSVDVVDNDAAVRWLRDNLREGDAVLFKASNGARLYEVAEALH